MIWRSRALNTLILTIGCVVPSAYSVGERRVPEEAFWANVESAEGDDDALRLSLRLEEADIRGLLALLADQRGISVLISDEVEGTLSMSLVGVLASDAWALVLQASGLAERQHRGVRYVAPAASIAQREEDLLTNAQTVEQLMPLETAVLRVRYARANQLLKHLASTHSLLSSRGEALVDERLNAVVINDLPTRIASIRELIARRGGCGCRAVIAGGAGSGESAGQAQNSHAGPVARVNSVRCPDSVSGNQSQRCDLNLFSQRGTVFECLTPNHAGSEHHDAAESKARHRRPDL